MPDDTFGQSTKSSLPAIGAPFLHPEPGLSAIVEEEVHSVRIS
jgi:hypothetical protein